MLGIVKDVFIPFKRRKVSNSRFVFVRFDCHAATVIATQKANGLCVDDKVLEVKIATYDRSNREEHSRRRPQTITGTFKKNRSRGKISYVDKRSFTEVLKGDTTIVAKKACMTIKVNEDGHGWLYESAIIRLKAKYSTQNVKTALKENGLDQVMVRNRGGRDVVLTFKSQEELKANICKIKEWFKNWNQFVMEWNLEFHIQQERCVWLRCYGIPLNIWNRNTLNNIGSMWGTVLDLDGDICQPKSFFHSKIKVVTSCMELINKTINLECKGKLHPILVCEEQFQIAPDCSSKKFIVKEYCNSNDAYCSEDKILEECCRDKEEGDEVAKGFGRSAAVLAGSSVGEEGDIVVEVLNCDRGYSKDKDACVKETMMEKSTHCPKSKSVDQVVCSEQVFTSGFIKSLSGSRDLLGPRINLEVDLAHSPGKHLISRPGNSRPLSLCHSHKSINSFGPHDNTGSNSMGIMCSNDHGQVRPTTINPKPQQKEKQKGKKRAQMEGFTSFARLHDHKVTSTSKHPSKTVIFRLAATAIALSDLSEGDSSMNKCLLNEAQATIIGEYSWYELSRERRCSSWKDC
ncbi:hypothetical protein ACSBR2_014862 [Camellia fascicularis]